MVWSGGANEGTAVVSAEPSGGQVGAGVQERLHVGWGWQGLSWAGNAAFVLPLVRSVFNELPHPVKLLSKLTMLSVRRCRML